mgnify:FL=1
MNRENDLIQYYTIDEIRRVRHEISRLTAKRFYSRKKLAILHEDLLRRIDHQLLELTVSVNVIHRELPPK